MVGEVTFDLDALEKLLAEALSWADWTAGEGICRAAGPSERDPDNFLFAYSDATGDEAWDTLSERLPKALVQHVRQIEAELREARRKLYVPGAWRCAKCEFVLIQSNLNAHDGSVTARDDPGDKCPNDGSPMWRMSWQDWAKDMERTCETQVERATTAEAERDEMREGLRPLAQADIDVSGTAAIGITAADILRAQALIEGTRK